MRNLLWKTCRKRPRMAEIRKEQTHEQEQNFVKCEERMAMVGQAGHLVMLGHPKSNILKARSRADEKEIPGNTWLFREFSGNSCCGF